MMFRAKTKLEKAIALGLKNGDLELAIDDSDITEISALADAKAIVDALRQLVAYGPSEKQFSGTASLCLLSGQVQTTETFLHLKERAVPYLLTLFKAGSKSSVEDKSPLLQVLRTLAYFQSKDGLDFIIESIQEGFLSDCWEWTYVYRTIDSQQLAWFCETVRGTFAQTGPAVFALFEFANAVMSDPQSEKKIDVHPFNDETGVSILELWLRQPAENSSANATEVVEAFPFLKTRFRDQLLSAALNSGDWRAQVAAAKVAVGLEIQEGKELLIRFCHDVHRAHAAMIALEELGLEDEIPDDSLEDEFQAKAALSDWLQHPNELGRQPDSLELAESRELYWPPTKDRRCLRLFRFAYTQRDSDEVATEFGLVGGKTIWSFFFLINPDWPIDDIFAFHCSWEMSYDPQHPGLQGIHDFSVEHGRSLLAAANP